MQICNKEFTRGENLRAHIQIMHIGEMDYMCVRYVTKNLL